MGLVSVIAHFDQTGGRPGKVCDGREDWDLDVAGYSDALQRPVVSGWKRVGPAHLENEMPDLDGLEVHIHEWDSVTLRPEKRAESPPPRRDR